VFRRTRWQPADGGSVTPLDRWLDEAEATYSRGVVQLACRLNRGSNAFAETAVNLKHAANLAISKETLRRIVEATGGEVLAASRRGDLVPEFTAEECRSPQGTTRVYFGCDGVMAPMVTDVEKRKRREGHVEKRRRLKARGRTLAPLPPPRKGADNAYKEFKLVTFYSQDQTRRVVSLTRGNHEAAGRIARRDANRIGLDAADERIGLYDGAAWIDKLTERHSLRLTDRGLDFYHLKDNVRRTRLAVFGETGAGTAWQAEVLRLFRDKGYEAGWNHLQATRTTRRGAARKTLDRLLHYVAERRELINYPEFRAQGFQIGSGPTESQCKCCTHRLKGRGRRWDRSNAEAVAALDALHQSGQWEQFWNLN